ncbi:hypothetical protein D9757_009048 [Collybiopsis confluens]|uniref:Uncharacterized protein n=1 Tax=Collybiopsis confluens TaxID=2823264 RepID=A0A8H5HDV0_9AGAR|nr:hypothetical protein D9757_009048 [Collybiopsis confluens]
MRKKTLRSLENLVDLHLGRSKNSPLYVRWACPDGICYDGTFPILSKLLEHSSRWYTAVLLLPDGKALEIALGLRDGGGSSEESGGEYTDEDDEEGDEEKKKESPKEKAQTRPPTFPESFPLLQELEMKLLQDDERDMSSPSFRAPNLRKLSINTFGYGCNFRSKFLEEITLSFVTANTTLEYLKDVPAGTGCKVHIVDLFTLDFENDDDDRFIDFPTFVSHLGALTITAATDFNEPEDATLKVIRNLTLPDVERLEIVNQISSVQDFPVEQIVSMLQRSAKSSPSMSSTLRHLCIDRYRMRDNELVTVLEHTPALTSLAMREAPGGDADNLPLTEEFFSDLVVGSSEDRGKEEVLVPNLARLEIEMHSEEHPWDSLYAFLESRRRPSSSENSSLVLKVGLSVRGPEWDRVRGTWEKKIEELGKSGVEVKVVERPEKKKVEKRVQKKTAWKK